MRHQCKRHKLGRAQDQRKLKQKQTSMDYDYNYHALENLFADKEKWEHVHSEGSTIYQDMISGLESFAHDVRELLEQFRIMTEKYFEPLERRNAAAYADAYSYFYAEKTTFDRLATFLRMEFYRGLAAGNPPRRCHNCGTCFLLTSGYNTCYCNNIAPGETKRACRKVGAHRKEAREKANRNPARVEYDRAYNRLKQKKNRKKINVNEWNAAVAEAMRILELAECGKLTDDEMKTRFREV